MENKAVKLLKRVSAESWCTYDKNKKPKNIIRMKKKLKDEIDSFLQEEHCSCAYCGKWLIGLSGVTAYNGKLFCSESCFRLYKSQKCAYCGEHGDLITRRVDGELKLFCSEKCWASFLSEKIELNYTFVVGTDISDLSLRVHRMLNKGWKVCGGPLYTRSENSCEFDICQAMVRS
jgi:hypothetical protein